MRQIFLKYLLLILLCWAGKTQGQITFTTQEDATATLDSLIPPIPTGFPNCLTNSTFQLTDETDWQTGAVWSNTTVNLNQNFVLEANLYLGDTDTGADGIAFVMQTGGTNVIGRTGGNMGYGNQPLTNDPTGAVTISPSVAIELDVFDNGDNWDDLEEDHLDIIYNGSTNNDGTNANGANFNAIDLPNMEDGNWHRFRLEYIVCANNECLKVYVDGNLVATHCDSIVDNVFNGVTNVNWGFTSSTGNSNNFQAFCLTAFSQSQPNFPTITVGDESICIGDQATLVPVVTGGIASFDYEWRNAANVLLGTQQNLTTGTAGDYAVTVTDDQGCTDSDTASVVVSNPSVTITGDRFLCLGESTTLTANLQGGVAPFTVEWEEEVGNTWTPVANGVALVVSPNQNTRYRVTVIDSVGCQTEDTIGINVRSILLTVSSDTSICEGETVILTANATYNQNPPNNNFNYTWSPTGQTGATIAVNPSNTTTYSVLATSVNQDYACTATIQRTVRVHDNPMLTLGTNPTGVLCLGDEVELTATNATGTINAIAWTGGGITTPVTTNPAILTALLGTTTYTATIADSNGCHAMDTIDVVVENCCFAQGNADYLQIDLDADASALGNYEIVVNQNIANIFLLNTNNKHIVLPNKVYIGNNVELVVYGGGTVDFTNSDVVVGRGSRIRVAGATMIANNAIFRPCEELQSWQGILFQSVANEETRSTFNECTFVNAHRAINDANFINFNPPFNTRPADGAFEGEITNNLFINCGRGIHISTFNFDGSITGNTFKVDDKAGKINYYDQVNGFFGLVMNLRNANGNRLRTISHNYPISQNSFIKGTVLDSVGINFQGIVMNRITGTNISNNEFTNNDRALIVINGVDIIIENNLFEITRHSNSDEQMYQLTIDGGANGMNRILVHKNRFSNSASIDASAQLGTGAIFVNRGSFSVIEENEIEGFETGVFTTRSVTRIVNNKIKSYLNGIVVSGYFYRTNRISTYIGCNDINLKINNDTTYSSTGILINAAQNAYPGNLNVTKVNICVEGNCVKNTNVAVHCMNTGGRNYRLPTFRHNYLYNYTDAGLFVDNLAGSTDGNNTFISNNLHNGTSSITWDIDWVNANGASTNDHFGVDGLAQRSSNVSINGNDARHSAAICGNQDLGQAATDVDLNCNNELITDPPFPITQRMQGGTTILSSNYQMGLSDLYKNNPNVLLEASFSFLQMLTDLNEVDLLYNNLMVYNWQIEEKNWLNYYYQVRKGEYTTARQILQSIVGKTEEEIDAKTVALVTLNSYEGKEITTAERTQLREVIRHNNSYRELARNLINLEKGGDLYQYDLFKITRALSSRNVTYFGDNKDLYFSIYPNPTNDNLNISIDLGEEKLEQASIYDVHGRLLQTKKIQAYQLTFDVSGFPRGMYFVTLQDETGELFTKKFIKE